MICGALDALVVALLGIREVMSGRPGPPRPRHLLEKVVTQAN